jgi:hypothetical protein
VVDSDLPNRKKHKAIMGLVRAYGGNKLFLRAFLLSVKRWLWDERTWSQRLAILGLSVTYATVGSLTAGLATAGAGIAVSVSLIVAGGGSLVGNMIDAIEQSAKKSS